MKAVKSLKCNVRVHTEMFFTDEGPMGSDEEPELARKRLRLSSEETDDPTSTTSAYSVVALPRKSSQLTNCTLEHSKPVFTCHTASVSEREESFEVTMTATELKDDLDQESGDQSKVFTCVLILNPEPHNPCMNSRLLNTEDVLCGVSVM